MSEREDSLPEIDSDCCTGCNECVIACSLEALVLVGDRVALKDLAECDYCGECEAVCPTGAIACPYEIVVE